MVTSRLQTTTVSVGRARVGVVESGVGRSRDRRSRERTSTALTEAWRPPAVRELLARAGSELAAAEDTADPAERYRHAHLCALRAGAAVLAMARPPDLRGRPRSVWELLEREAPELRHWAAYFASGATLRAAVESGRDPVVPTEVAEDQLTMATRFIDLVEDLPAALAS